MAQSAFICALLACSDEKEQRASESLHPAWCQFPQCMPTTFCCCYLYREPSISLLYWSYLGSIYQVYTMYIFMFFSKKNWSPGIWEPEKFLDYHLRRPRPSSFRYHSIPCYFRSFEMLGNMFRILGLKLWGLSSWFCLPLCRDLLFDWCGFAGDHVGDVASDSWAHGRCVGRMGCGKLDLGEDHPGCLGWIQSSAAWLRSQRPLARVWN